MKKTVGQKMTKTSKAHHDYTRERKGSNIRHRGGILGTSNHATNHAWTGWAGKTNTEHRGETIFANLASQKPRPQRGAKRGKQNPQGKCSPCAKPKDTNRSVYASDVRRSSSTGCPTIIPMRSKHDESWFWPLVVDWLLETSTVRLYKYLGCCRRILATSRRRGAWSCPSTCRRPSVPP